MDARRYVLAHMSGVRMVDMVWEDLKLSKALTREAFDNAIRVNAAIGGSTNAVIHPKAIVGRLGVSLELEDWTNVGKGGLLPHKNARTVNGKSIRDNVLDAPIHNAEVIRPHERHRGAACGARGRPNGHPSKGGYQQPSIDRVLQADEGCDFDCLVGCRGAQALARTGQGKLLSGSGPWTRDNPKLSYNLNAQEPPCWKNLACPTGPGTSSSPVAPDV